MKTTATPLLSLAAALCVICQSQPAVQAAPGILDLTFGGTGKVVAGFGGGQASANASAVQSDGKLILAGYRTTYYSLGGEFLLTRFDTNNLLDPSFGVGGKVITSLTTNTCAIQALAIQTDGKILAAGYAYRNPTNANFAVVRYNPDGSIDTSFGTNGNGTVFTDFGQHSVINAIAFQADGKIVVDGYLGYPGANNAGIALARYQTNGLLDPNFGNGGTIAVPGGEYDLLLGLMIQPDQRIVAVGGAAGAEFAIYRFTTNGTTDASFGSGSGHVYTSFGTGFKVAQGNCAAFQVGSITLGSPDTIVAAGTFTDYNANPTRTYQLLIRYGMNGALDPSFGNGGIVTNLIGAGTPTPSSSSLQIFGTGADPRKIVVGGSYWDNFNYYFAVNRYNAAGQPDNTFGANNSGKISIPVRNVESFAEATATSLAVQSGKFIVSGFSGLIEGGISFAMTRFTSEGLVDTAFGTNGLLLADVADGPSQANATAIQSDGKIVVVGRNTYLTNNNVNDRFTLARFNADGSLDASFGTRGKATLNFGASSSDDANAVALQPDGKIIAAGSSSSAFALARFNSNGSVDPSFGTNGVTTAPLAGGGQVNALQILPNGKILAAGYVNPGTFPSFALARFNSNGILDTNFGSAGYVLSTFSAPYDLAFGMAIQPDGKIALAGTAISVSGANFSGDFAAARYSTNGSLDFTFGTLGRATGNVGGGTINVGYAMALQPDGKILVAGGASLGSFPGPVTGNQSVNSFLAVMRFTTNGLPDNSFGNGGGVITQVGAFSDFATCIALQSDGKIVVAGATQNGYYRFFALRYNTNGTVDNSYGNDGTTLVDFGTATNEIPYGLALDSYNRAVLVGDAGGVFGIARLQGNAIASPMLKISLTSTNTAVVSWPYPSAGWSLKECNNPVTPAWTTPLQAIANDGTNNFIVVAPPFSSHFYRLQSP